MCKISFVIDEHCSHLRSRHRHERVVQLLPLLYCYARG